MTRLKPTNCQNYQFVTHQIFKKIEQFPKANGVPYMEIIRGFMTTYMAQNSNFNIKTYHHMKK